LSMSNTLGMSDLQDKCQVLCYPGQTVKFRCKRELSKVSRACVCVGGKASAWRL